ncbi:MAG: Gfo/Idh/MocA family oxidoreductase [Planctomycetota bacterium]|nr:Gfo/Idh/MocA family oxidoreductase [Planctomycetota bacterium]
MRDYLTTRRHFLEAVGAGSLAAMAARAGEATPPKAPADGEKPAPAEEKKWTPVSDRKIRMGIVGYGVCQFGAAFGFQDHPNVEVVAVSDLIPARRDGLMKACRCAKSYESLEELVKDPLIEAVFVATDAPSHPRHCIEVLNHGKHVMTAVPAVFGSLEDADKLLETVKKCGLKYMMAETSCFHAELHAMRQIYRAGGFGRIIFSEGEYFHYCPTPIDSYKGWRVGVPPQWYPTHSNAYYVGVTRKRFVTVSCAGFRGAVAHCQPDANPYRNPFSDEVALFTTSEGGMSRMAVCWGMCGAGGEKGRVYGEKGSMETDRYHGLVKGLPDVARPPLPPGVAAGGHGGSHGYLSSEFVAAILEKRDPLIDVYEALAITVPGIIAHQSALKDGETMKLPQFERPKE